jgi:CubicO group peptidase (beta-lactamase class C family)
MRSRSTSALPAAFCLLLLAATAAGRVPAPPDTPQGKRIAALLAAFETGTPETLRTFVTANFAASAQEQVPLEERVRRLGGMVREIGPLEFHSLLGGAGPEVLFLARARKSGDWMEVGIMLEPPPAFGILGLKFEASDGPGAAVDKPLGSDAAVAKEADAALRRQADAGEFSGVVLLAKDGKIFFLDAYGLANRDFSVPNRTDTKFNLGSVNKMFTQVAIAQLAAPGRIALSDTVRKHLPDYPSPAADRITIQQLLTMSSGLGDFFGPNYDATPKAKLRALADFLPLFVNEPLLFEPGTDRRYSNAGYVVLGLIIEKVSGQSYHDYVRQHVFQPAGMTSSDAYPQDEVVANRAVGYTTETEDGSPKANRPLHVNIYALPARSSSAGGGYATAADLLAFDQALRHDKLLPAVWTDWYYTDKSKAPAATPPASTRCSRRTSTRATPSSCSRTWTRPRQKGSRRDFEPGSA